MQDSDLYQHILGLTSPWTVADVKLVSVQQPIRNVSVNPPWRDLLMLRVADMPKVC